jgi:ABC-type molybdenum transport system ATPase subunit/photorepair protein PhrA
MARPESWTVLLPPAPQVRAARAGSSIHVGVPAVVELIGVSASVERTPVLRDLSLQMAAGEAVGLLGANGSGKSTLLRVLSTLLPPVGGRGWVLGAELVAAYASGCVRASPSSGMPPRSIRD